MQQIPQLFKRWALQTFSVAPALPKLSQWWGGAFLLWVILAGAGAAQALEMRVALQENAEQVKVGSSSNAVVRNGAGEILGQIAAMNGFSAQIQNGFVAVDRWKAGQIWIEPTAEGFVFVGDRWYRGRVLLVPGGKGLTAINYVDLEAYLASVVGGEISDSWPMESLKAQAVAARSYALHQREPKLNSMYDLGATQDSQVYRGIETESTNTQLAVNATAGQVLTYNGQIILAAFHSCSGGKTVNVEDVWTQALPYLRSVPDYLADVEECRPWSRTLSTTELSQSISGVGKIISMTPEAVAASGHIITLKVVGDAGTRSLAGDEVRAYLDLKSIPLRVTPQGSPSTTDNKAGKTPPSAFIIQGAGFGHGIGMSQWGAYTLAKQQYDYKTILTHYYQGTTLSQIQVQ
jgi:stage II sporulation protein D